MNNIGTRRPSRRNNEARRAQRGFSLVELISVFLIISVLIGLAIGVGRSVLQSRGERATQNVLQVLDQALSTYIAAKNAKPPEFFTDRAGNKFPLLDARTGTGGPSATAAELVPSLSLAILVMQDVPECKALLNQIPPEFIKRSEIVVAGQTVQIANAGGAAGSTDNTGLIIVDAWGEPIRFVHPAFHGRFGDSGAAEPIIVGTSTSNFTRMSTTDFADRFDSDEGYCPNNRPYFYSGGLDQKAGTRKDNLYSTTPVFAAEANQERRQN